LKHHVVVISVIRMLANMISLIFRSWLSLLWKR